MVGFKYYLHKSFYAKKRKKNQSERKGVQTFDLIKKSIILKYSHINFRIEFILETIKKTDTRIDWRASLLKLT